MYCALHLTTFVSHGSAINQGVYYVYLMFKRDLGYRIGTAVAGRFDHQVGVYVNGLMARTRLEFGDKTWVLRVCHSRAEASLHEQLLSVKYGIPTALFHVVGRTGLNCTAERASSISSKRPTLARMPRGSWQRWDCTKRIRITGRRPLRTAMGPPAGFAYT